MRTDISEDAKGDRDKDVTGTPPERRRAPGVEPLLPPPEPPQAPEGAHADKQTEADQLGPGRSGR